MSGGNRQVIATRGAASKGRAGERALQNARGRVDAFVARHFTWPGTLHLHRAALGGDILRAPVNVALAPLHVLAMLTAWLLRRLGARRAADWLARRRILLPTAVSRRVETLVATELLGLPLETRAGGDRTDALARAVLAAPQFRDLLRRRDSPGEVAALGGRVAATLGAYAGTRSAVAEMTTTLCILATGALAFRALTPGMISMAPGVADAVTRAAAIADFPLGRTLGSAWYGLFGAGAPPWLVALTLAGLLMLGSVVAAFAGVLADPVQSRLGIHRRRLLRLLDTLDSELAGRDGRSFAAREHYYARFMDLWDAAASVTRIFRN